MFSRLLFIVFSLIVFTSCDDGTIVELPINQPKLVVNCVGQNDRLWQCRISSSKNILEFLPFNPVSNATVKLYEDGKFIESLKLLNQYDKDLYGSETFSPLQGKSYKIIVSANSFDSVSSNYFHPKSVPIDALSVKILGPSKSSENGTDVNLTIEFNDPLGQNFYGIIVKRKTEDSPTPGGAEGLGLSFLDPAYNENKQIFYETIIFSDTFFEGKQAVIDLAATVSSLPGDLPMNYYSAYLMNLSEEYYSYLKTASLQKATKNDPFAQPTKVESNIVGGFGIFGGFTETTKTIYAPH